MNSLKLLVTKTALGSQDKNQKYECEKAEEEFWQECVGDDRGFEAREVKTLYMRIWQWQRKTLIWVT